MLPRLMFVLGMTVGVTAPLIWMGYISLPPANVTDKGLTSNEGKEASQRHLAPDSINSMIPEEPPTIDRPRISPGSSDNKPMKAATSPSVDAESETTKRPAPSQNRSTPTDAGAETLTSSVVKGAGDGRQELSPSSQTTSSVANTIRSRSASKPSDSLQARPQMPTAGATDSAEDPAANIDTSSAAPQEENRSLSYMSQNLRDNDNPKVGTFEHRQIKKSHKRLEHRSSMRFRTHHDHYYDYNWVDRDFCGFGSYLACFYGQCWRFCY
jgi:hypothetical protein